MTIKAKTQFVYKATGEIYPTMPQPSIEVATNYARDLSSRLQGECRVLGEYDQVVAVYDGGEKVER